MDVENLPFVLSARVLRRVTHRGASQPPASVSSTGSSAPDKNPTSVHPRTRSFDTTPAAASPVSCPAGAEGMDVSSHYGR